MKIIFAPAVKLMNKLKYSRKFALIFILFLIPLSILLTMQLLDAQKVYDVKTKQSKGIEASILLRTMIKHTQERRGMSSVYLNGNSDFKENIKTEHEKMFSDMGIKIKFLIAVNKK